MSLTDCVDSSPPTRDQIAALDQVAAWASEYGWTWRGLALRRLCGLDRAAAKAVVGASGPDPHAGLLPAMQAVVAAQRAYAEGRAELATLDAVLDREDRALDRLAALFDELAAELQRARDVSPGNQALHPAVIRAADLICDGARRLQRARVDLAAQTSPAGLNHALRARAQRADDQRAAR